MSVLGTHEITAGIGLGLEPPLSPPVVRGPNARLAEPDGLSDLPTPPPAIRPPESALHPQEPTPAPEPEQSQPESEPLISLQPLQAPAEAQPEPVQTEPVAPAAQPEPALPTMAPEAPAAAPVQDYFAAPAPTPVPEDELAVPATTEPAQTPDPEPIPLVVPTPAPTEVPAAELPPLVAPPEPEVVAEPEQAPAVFMAPEPEISLAEISAEPELEEQTVAPEPAPEHELPALEAELAVLQSLPVTKSPEPEPAFDPFAGTRGLFRVIVRLKDTDGVEVGAFRDFGTAMEGAQEVIEQFSNATDGSWPFYAGRFIRPDLIVSVDVVEGDSD